MSKMESSDNFYSFVNENDHEEENDVGLEDEDEVDCEVQNYDYGDYDDFWIPGLLKDECISFETIVDIRQFDMEKMSVEDVSRLDFAELELAYLFYCWYAKITGFSIRKSHIVRNTCRETLQQTFFCSCAGYRRHKGWPLWITRWWIRRMVVIG